MFQNKEKIEAFPFDAYLFSLQECWFILTIPQPIPFFIYKTLEEHLNTLSKFFSLIKGNKPFLEQALFHFQKCQTIYNS